MASIHEFNVIRKNWRKTNLRIALCYPNVYRAGMTGLTIRLLYALLNIREDVVCERFFIPTLREPLLSFESNAPLSKFDVIAFTLQFEEDYPYVIKMLLDSNIPLLRKERIDTGPLVIAGGPCATANPEPLADYVDLFVIGDAEPILNASIDKIIATPNPSRHIQELCDLKSVYLPEYTDVTERAYVKNLDDAPHPLAQQIPDVVSHSPYMTVFGRCFAVETVRGCNRGCKFCLIGKIDRPLREKSISKIETIIEEGIRFTPVKKIALIGAGIFDHSHLEDICEFIVSQKLEIALPSLRPERVTERLAKLLVKGHQRTVSLAPDGATPAIWESTSKCLKEEFFIDAAKILHEKGLRRIKLYYMIGFPGETSKDLDGIVGLSKKIADAGYGPKTIHLSINPLIPKPHTSFQREKTPSIGYIRQAFRSLKQGFKGDSRIILSCMDPRRAQIQSLLSLGDRKLGKTIELRARYDHGLGGWRRALKETGISLEDYNRVKEAGEPLPWNNILIS